MHIGPYRLSNPWILAPMAGVSEMPFRVIVREMGAAAAPTELVSAKGLLYGQSRTERYLTHAPSETPFWVQIFGGDPDVMAAGAAQAAELGADIIDINMGCPVKKVTKGGAGSSLLCDPTRAAHIVAAIVARTGLPVTAKIRSGWDAHSINCIDMVRALADAGCCAVALHARTRAQGYSGQADWQLIRDVVQASPIPIIGNGDVITPQDAHRMREQTGCSAVMIGRGALGNPWLFRQLANGLLDGERPSPAERWQLVRRHLAAHIEFVGDVVRAIRRFRQHLMWYAHGLRGATEFRRSVTTIEDLDALVGHCEAFFAQATTESATSDAPDCDLRLALG